MNKKRTVEVSVRLLECDFYIEGESHKRDRDRS